MWNSGEVFQAVNLGENAVGSLNIEMKDRHPKQRAAFNVICVLFMQFGADIEKENTAQESY
jgi:hypothetical protein